MGASLNPDTFTGGGFLEEGFYAVPEARFVRWDYDGAAEERAFIRLKLAPESGGEEHIQYWSIAALKDFVPSDDGRTLEQVGRRAAFNDNSNGAELMRSLVNAGYPKDRLSDDVAAVFEGGVFYFGLQDAPERGGFQQNVKTNAQGQPYKQQIAVVMEVKQLPGAPAPRQASRPVPPSQRGRTVTTTNPALGQRSPAVAPAPGVATVPHTAQGGSANGPAASDEARGEAVAFLMQQLAEGPLARGVLSTRVLVEYGSSPLRGQILGLVNNPTFLEESGVKIAGAELSLS